MRTCGSATFASPRIASPHHVRRRMGHRAALLTSFLAILLVPGRSPGADPAPARDYDVLVYGGTSAGVTAAVEAARLGKRVALLETSGHLGGLSSAGLGFTDLGNPNIVGGLARDFYHRVYLHYQSPAAWKFGTREAFLASSAQGAKAI